MDITKFVVGERSKAFLYGDYASYRSSLSQKLRNCRKHLGQETKNRAKFQKKAGVTAEQIGGKSEYLHLLLYTCERSWADAMSMKAVHSVDSKGVHGRVRSQIISKLDKAARSAESLVELLETAASAASETDVLEAKAYATMVRGTTNFERQSWEACLVSYAVAHVVYNALGKAAKGKDKDNFKDLLAETIDPSIRYAAYQLKMPRTLSIPSIARQVFPASDAALVEAIAKLDPAALKGGADPAAQQADDGDGPTTAQKAPKTLTWRSLEVRIEDAAISLAWGALDAAKARLQGAAAADGGDDARPAAAELAAAYDEVLTASQEAVDATRTAMEELRAEGVAQGDARMQSLQVTRTAVNYELISWRIGRNRVLVGRADGAAALDSAAGPLESKRSAKRRRAAEEKGAKVKDVPPSRLVARLREKVALYDATLQSIESIQELPGVAADEELTETLAATLGYFYALKCLSIARSHSIAGNQLNALALAKAAFDKCVEIAGSLDTKPPGSSPLNIQVYASDVEALHDVLRGEVARYRALVELETLQKKAAASASATSKAPLITHLNEYPVGGAVDLSNIVVYPPKLEPIPAKPIFLDVAWNYIQYPDKIGREDPKKKSDDKASTQPAEGSSSQPQKKGWFSFGR